MNGKRNWEVIEGWMRTVYSRLTISYMFSFVVEVILVVASLFIWLAALFPGMVFNGMEGKVWYFS